MVTRVLSEFSTNPLFIFYDVTEMFLLYDDKGGWLLIDSSKIIFLSNRNFRGPRFHKREIARELFCIHGTILEPL